MTTRFLWTLIGAVQRQALGGFAPQFALGGVRESGFGMASRMQGAIAHLSYPLGLGERPNECQRTEMPSTGTSFEPGVVSSFSIGGSFASLSTYHDALPSNGIHSTKAISNAIEIVGRWLTINDFAQLKSGRDRACPTSP